MTKKIKVPNRDILIAINENKVAISQCMSIMGHMEKKIRYIEQKINESFERIERKLVT